MAAVFCSCQNADKPSVNDADVVVENTYHKLRKFYKDTTFNDLYIYPDTGTIDSLFVFKGRAIDTNVLKLLPGDFVGDLAWSSEYYGIYCFDLDSVYTGFITRIPGEYSSSDISLWLFDRKNDELVKSMDLASLFGDAGDYCISNSCLFFDKGKLLNVLNKMYYSYDHSVEDENDSALDVSHSFLHTRWRNHTIDTLSKDSLTLYTTYPLKMKGLIY